MAGARLPAVLVVEDGQEYSQNLQRFLLQDVELHRAGDAFEALERIRQQAFQVAFLDMRFDRALRLLGEDEELRRRLGGDPARVRRHLEEHQGTYILAALRAAGFRRPVLMSYDFDGEPRRFQHLRRLYDPVEYLPDTAGPTEIRSVLLRLAGAP